MRLSHVLLLAVLLIAAAPPPPTLQRISVGAAEGDVDLGIVASRSLLTPAKDVTRIVVILPETGGTAAATLAALGPAAGPGTMIVVPEIAPQAEAGVQLLRWSGEDWASGRPAQTPAPASLFTALDSLAAWLTDPGLFPAAGTIVVAGRGQAAEAIARYAALGRLAPGIAARGIDLRFVAADPPGCATVEGAASIDGALSYRLGETPDGVDATYDKRDIRYLIRAVAACPALASRHTGRGKEVHVVGDSANPLLTPCGRSLVFGEGECPAEAPPPPPASEAAPASTETAQTPAQPQAKGPPMPMEHPGDVLDLADPISPVITKPESLPHR